MLTHITSALHLPHKVPFSASEHQADRQLKSLLHHVLLLLQTVQSLHVGMIHIILLYKFIFMNFKFDEETVQLILLKDATKWARH